MSLELMAVQIARNAGAEGEELGMAQFMDI